MRGAAPPAATPPAPVSAAALVKQFFSKEVPPSELWRTHFGRLSSLAPIESAIQDAALGMMRPLTDLSREMLDLDPQLSMLAQKRFGALSALDWEITPAEGPGVVPARADLYASVVRDQVARIPAFRQRLFDLAWGFYDNRAALENLWRGPLIGPVRWEIAALGWIHPRRISYGPEREFRILDGYYSTAYFPAIGEELRRWPYKFVEFRPRLFGEYPEREGLAIRSLYWAFFKRFGVRERLILTELYGKPWRVIEADPAAPAPQIEDFADVDRQIAALGGNNIARLPRGFTLNVQKPGEGSGGVHKDVITYADDQMSKLWVGQTMTSDAAPQGIGGKQAEVHENQQLMWLRRDAWAISEAIEDGLTDAIVALNWGPEALSHAPNFRLISDRETDRTVEIDRIDKAARAGLPIAIEQAYELSGFRPPEAGEAVLVMTTPAGELAARPIVVGPADIIGAIPEMPDPPAPRLPPGGGGNGFGGDPAADGAGADDGEADLPIAAAGPPTFTEWLLSREPADPTDRADFAAAPGTVNGSPDAIVARAVKEAARETARWAERVATATAGLTSANAILRKATAAAASIDLAPMARIAERRMMHALMLGALDAAWEAETDRAVAPEAYAISVPPGAAPAEPGFANKPYDAALRWFRKKKVIDKATFEELSARAKQRAFTVARMASHEMLETVHAELYKQVAAGADLRDFARFAKERLESKGFVPASPAHVETVFRTNVANAYGAGRHAEMTQPLVLKLRPYWQLLGVDDSRTRPTHKAVHNWVLRADDPIWQRAYPPFGFSCRCRVRSLSPEQVAKLGLTVRAGTDVAGLPDAGFVSGTPALV